MTFRESLALTLSPLVMRIVLGATFLWAGIPKLQMTTFEGDAADVLVELGVAPAAATVTTRQHTPGAGAANEGGAAEGAEGEQPSPSEAAPGESPTEGSPSDAAAKSVTFVEARGLYGVAVMLHNAHHPLPVAMAWIAALTEAVGGGLILLGLFTRFWGAGLAVAMVYAFALSSWPQISAFLSDTSAGSRGLWDLHSMDYLGQTSAILQIALFGMALAVFLTGPGAVSIDRLLFAAPASSAQAPKR